MKINFIADCLSLQVLNSDGIVIALALLNAKCTRSGIEYIYTFISAPLCFSYPVCKLNNRTDTINHAHIFQTDIHGYKSPHHEE